MLFKIHRKKITITFVLILLFKSDAFAFNLHQIEAEQKHYVWESSDSQHLFFPNTKVINKYTFSTFNKFYYPNIKGHTITSKYFRTLTRHLLDKSLGLEIMRNTFSMSPENKESDIYSETASDIQEIERLILINSIWNAGIEVYKNSAFYQKIQYYENEIKRYLVIEYSKSISDTDPGFYLPGELSDEKKKEKKEYQISLSTLVAPDNESAQMDLNLNFVTLFFHNRAMLSYSATRQNTSLAFFNSRLNSYLGADLTFNMQKVFEDNSVYRLSIAFRY